MGTSRVLVLGYGEMGHAMEVLLGERVHLDIWEKYPSAGFQSVVLEDAVPAADIILFFLPVNPHREIVEKIRPLFDLVHRMVRNPADLQAHFDHYLQGVYDQSSFE